MYQIINTAYCHGVDKVWRDPVTLIKFGLFFENYEKLIWSVYFNGNAFEIRSKCSSSINFGCGNIGSSQQF